MHVDIERPHVQCHLIGTDRPVEIDPGEFVSLEELSDGSTVVRTYGGKQRWNVRESVAEINAKIDCPRSRSVRALAFKKLRRVARAVVSNSSWVPKQQLEDLRAVLVECDSLSEKGWNHCDDSSSSENLEASGKESRSSAQ